MEELNLSNFGVLIDTINDTDFKKIKKECLSKDKVPYETGISSNQIADHFELIKTRDILFSFLRKKITDYDKRYNYFESIKKYNGSKPNLVFTTPWFNVQKPGQYLSNHFHDGVLSYTVWVDIPFSEKEGDENNEKYNSCFELLYTNIVGQITGHKIFIDKSYEGKMIMFPSTLLHCVYPFYKAKKNRISIAGNILIQ